jgi:hypothetical protein
MKVSLEVHNCIRFDAFYAATKLTASNNTQASSHPNLLITLTLAYVRKDTTRSVNMVSDPQTPSIVGY